MPLSPLARERATLLVLAAVQFTHVVDFMIMVPLGPYLMDALALNPAQFANVVAVFGIAAGAAGFGATFVFDRFDRKRTLLVLFAGLAIATLACGLAPTHGWLLVARVSAGVFGGLTGSVITTIVGDIVPRERRGRGMAFVMSAFAIGQVLGVPIGLWLAERYSWHMPFFVLAGLSLPIWLAAAMLLPAVRAHVAQNAGTSAWALVHAIVREPNHWRAFALVGLLTMSGMIIVPFLPASLVSNAGVPREQVAWIYVCGGLATLVTNNWFGRLGDRAGHVRVFNAVAIFAILPAIAVTSIGHWPLPVILVVTTLFMISMGGRWTPAMSLVTMSVPMRMRGGFMSLNAAIQSLFMGIAALLSGQIVHKGTDGRIENYLWAGVASMVALAMAAVLIRRLRMVDDHVVAVVPAVESGAAD